MRILTQKTISLFLGTGISVAGALSGAACNGDGFDGCEASKTCGAKAAAGSGNVAGQGGTGGNDSAAKGGKSGSSGAGAGRGSTAGKAGAPATGGTGGSDDSADAGSDDGNEHEPDDTSAGGRDDGGEDDETMGGAAGADLGSDPEPQVDDIAPGIVEVSPTNMQAGVHEDAEIVVTFDEPMDNASSEAAFASPQLASNEVDFYWRDDSRQLIIKPQESLDYADLTSPDGDAKTYVFTIRGTATDVAGNPLGSDHTYAFTTLRHVTHALSVPVHGVVAVTMPGERIYSRCQTGEDSFSVGDMDDDHAYASLVTFDISSLPAGIVEWGDVRLHALLAPTPHLPYGGRLGDLHYLSVAVKPESAKWQNVGEVDLGVYASNGGHTDVTRSVKTALPVDYAEREARGNLSQYLWRFDQVTDEDLQASYVEMRCGDVSLDLEYWVP
jgi:hypothetical protein